MAWKKTMCWIVSTMEYTADGKEYLGSMDHCFVNREDALQWISENEGKEFVCELLEDQEEREIWEWTDEEKKMVTRK